MKGNIALLFFQRLCSPKLFRFIFVGGLSTILDFVIYIILSSALPLNLSKFLSMCCSCTFSFFCNRSWTFRDTRRLKISHISKYIFVQTINIFVNVTSNSILFTVLHLNKLLSFCIATCIAMTINYILQKTIVFQHS